MTVILGLNTGIFSLGSIAIGAATEFLLDPKSGRRRRAMLQDRVSRSVNDALHFAHVAQKDFTHRASGMMATFRGQKEDMGPDLRVGLRDYTSNKTSDERLVRRVRSTLGRYVSHPHALKVSCDSGLVTLSGPILATEFDRLMKAVFAISGVKDVEQLLDVHHDPSHISSLQGGRHREPVRFDFLQHNWSPTTRLLLGGTGGGLCAGGVLSGGLGGGALICLGAPLLVRSVTNKTFKELFGVGSAKRGVTIKKTIEINAGIEDVFLFFSQFSNFPRFMHNIKRVKDLGESRSHWVVRGPAGLDFSWNARITACVANESLAWQTEQGAQVMHSGFLRFEAKGKSKTRVGIHMVYAPPIGAFGLGLAQILGANPKTEMAQDLMRAKTFLETGHAAKDAAATLQARAQNKRVVGGEKEDNVPVFGPVSAGVAHEDLDGPRGPAPEFGLQAS